jgi:tripartite-type tricarboxylate transporter receptor subunit TctC
VPYRGGADAARDLAAGVIDACLNSVGSLNAAFAAGARPLMAVTAHRIPSLPGVPTSSECGIDNFVLNDICGLFAPAATPPERVTRLQQAVAAALRTQEMQDRLAGMDVEGVGSTPAEFAAFITAESNRLGSLIRAAGIKLS